MAKMRPPCPTLLILILVISSAPQPSQSSFNFNQYRTLLSLSDSHLKRVANLRAERGDISGVFGLAWSVGSLGWDYMRNHEWREQPKLYSAAECGNISGSNRVKLISQKLERGLESGFFGLAWSVGSLGWDYMRNQEWREQPELYGAAERGDISGLNRVKLISQKLERGIESGFFGLAWSVGSLGWDYMRNHEWREQPELYGAAERSDISGSNRVMLISKKLERGLESGFFGFAWSVGSLGWDYMRNHEWREQPELYGAVSDLNELTRSLSELMRVDSVMGRATWFHQNYGNVLGVSKRLFVGPLKVFSQSGALREVVETVKIEVVDGELLRDCLEVGSNDLKGLIQVFNDLVLQYSLSPSPNYGRDL
ncbi:hypothetical protein LWI29_008345 [Acer saccharum]|uniref:Uncharacterized protein n=1 Tax=Acer saccharum TaxID=4024 RepID=A0AA39V6W8_ACESA|nr:hypothetical protein LWI29_008345 [Acer saccharum]